MTALEASWDALDSFDSLESTRSTQVYPRYKRPFPDVPMPMVNRILKEGYSPEIHTVEEFVLKAKSIENYEKMKAYFEAMKRNIRNNTPAVVNKPTPKNAYACHKTGQQLAEEVPKGTPLK